MKRLDNYVKMIGGVSSSITVATKASRTAAVASAGFAAGAAAAAVASAVDETTDPAVAGAAARAREAAIRAVDIARRVEVAGVNEERISREVIILRAAQRVAQDAEDTALEELQVAARAGAGEAESRQLREALVAARERAAAALTALTVETNADIAARNTTRGLLAEVGAAIQAASAAAAAVDVAANAPAAVAREVAVAIEQANAAATEAGNAVQAVAEVLAAADDALGGAAQGRAAAAMAAAARAAASAMAAAARAAAAAAAPGAGPAAAQPAAPAPPAPIPQAVYYDSGPAEPTSFNVSVYRTKDGKDSFVGSKPAYPSTSVKSILDGLKQSGETVIVSSGEQFVKSLNGKETYSTLGNLHLKYESVKFFVL